MIVSPLILLALGGGIGAGAFSPASSSPLFSSSSSVARTGRRGRRAIFPPSSPPYSPASSGDALLASSSGGVALLSTSAEQTTDAGADAGPSDDSAPAAPPRHYDSVIVGGGPAGLLTAIMLAQTYGPSHRIALYERRPDTPPSPSDDEVWNDVARFYLLGLGHRGQSALRRFGVYDDFEKASVAVEGRRDWKPGMTREEDGIETPARKDVTSRVLARDKLVGVLHHHILENYMEAGNIDLKYGYQVDPVSFGNEKGREGDPVVLRVSRCEDANAAAAEGGTPATYQSSSESEQTCDVDSSELITADLLVAADGSARTVANAMEKSDLERRSRLKNPVSKLFAPKPFRVTRYEDTNPRVYKSVPLRIPSHWKPTLNYSARSRDNRITLEALPSNDRGDICALLLMKPDDDFAKANCDPKELRSFFDEEFPCFSQLVNEDVMNSVATKPASTLPAFRYAGPRLNMGRRTVVLGDAAHTVKPYYGLGANTALEDVSFLCDALEDGGGKDDVGKGAVELFSERRAGDAKALVQISRGMDRPGKWGTMLFFVLPLVLDSVFHKALPGVFGPTMFGMFQKRGMGFEAIRRKKRVDRTLQMMIIGAGMTGMGVTVKAMVAAVARAMGRSQIFVGGNMAALLVAFSTLQKMIKKDEPEAQAS